VAEQDRIIAVLPFFHIYGMQVVLNLALWRGATLVTMPRFELEPFLATVQQYRITRAFVVPPLVLALAQHPAVDRYDLSSLRAMMSGAAPLEADLETACARRLGCGFIQGYGLTEASPVTHANSDEPGKCKPGTVGPLVPNTECRIVDAATGADLGPDEDGELLIRGPQVMAGYLNNPEATAATLDAAGWLHTGDIGRVDRDGYFTIVDRLKELIKYKGFQVPPAELEALPRGAAWLKLKPAPRGVPYPPPRRARRLFQGCRRFGCTPRTDTQSVSAYTPLRPRPPRRPKQRWLCAY